MNIASVEAWQPIDPNSPPDWRTTFGQIAVRISVDEGLVGYGVGGGGTAGINVIECIVAPLLTGLDAVPVEDLWHRMYAATLPFGRRGIAVMALSGVDLALWDLRAKAAGQSVTRLLSARAPRTIPTYSTVWDEIDEQTATGTQGVKVHLHPAEPLTLQSRGLFVEQAVERITQARSRIGPGRSLMVDAWMKWDVPSTLAIARQIDGLNVDWIEEPLSPDDLVGYRRLRDEGLIPIAGGEHEFTPYGFAPLIDERLHQILQPDVCWCGGLTSLIRIYEMATAAGLRVVPHRGSEVWALPAIAARDERPLAEEGRSWMSWVRGQPPIVDGTIDVPEGPGFGVDLAGR